MGRRRETEGESVETRGAKGNRKRKRDLREKQPKNKKELHSPPPEFTKIASSFRRERIERKTERIERKAERIGAAAFSRAPAAVCVFEREGKKRFFFGREREKRKKNTE